MQREPRVLFNQQQRDAFARHRADGFKNFLHHDRRQAHAGFIEQQQSWLAHQRAHDGEHLLFAAGECAGELAAALGEAREGGVGALAIQRNFGFVAAKVSTHRQIFFDGQPREHAAAFGHQRQPALYQRKRRRAGDVLAVVVHAARSGFEQAAERL